MSIKKVTITGAAGNIAYSLIFRILSKLPFKATDKIDLTLLDIELSQKYLTGLRFEIEDCAFSSLNEIAIPADSEKAFDDYDYLIMVGARPRSKGMARSGLIMATAGMLKAPGLISGFFLIFYSIFRFVIECLRVPDEQLGYLFFTLDMGQSISFIFFLIGSDLVIKKTENSKIQ